MSQLLFEVSSSLGSGSLEFLERDGFTGQFWSDRPAEVGVVEVDPDLADIAWVVSHAHLFTDVGGQHWGDVAGGGELDPIALYFPCGSRSQ